MEFDRDVSYRRETESFMEKRSKEKIKVPLSQRNVELKTKALDPKLEPSKKSNESLEPSRLQLGPVGGAGKSLVCIESMSSIPGDRPDGVKFTV